MHCCTDSSQLNVTKHFVYGAVAFIWIVIPTIEITFTVLTLDIVQGKCGRFADYAVKKSFALTSLFITYFLPLSLMVFCYGRVVHALRSKVIL